MRAPASSFSLGSVLFLVLAGCSSASSSGSAAPATPPSPFVLQFVGSYGSGSRSIALHRDGTYDASLTGQGEEGSYASAPGAKDLPLHLTFTSVTGTFTGSIDSYESPKLRVTFADQTTESLDPQGTVGPDESLCDETHGTWQDDDRDEASGTYCLCPAPKVYIPSLGGCVD